MMCELGERLEQKVKEAERQHVLAERELQWAPAGKGPSQQRLQKINEVWKGAQAALDKHTHECSACQTVHA